MSKDDERNRANETEATPGRPAERPAGGAAQPDAGPTAERPCRRRDFLGITAKLIAGAAVGLPAGAEALGAAVSSTDPGEGEAWCWPLTQNIRNCTTASPNTCTMTSPNQCTGRTKNVCTGSGANTCQTGRPAGNTCEAGPRSGNVCLDAGNANRCNITDANQCSGGVTSGGPLGNECRGAGRANTCSGKTGRDANACQGAPGANTCRGAIAANACEGAAPYNVCRSDASNRCENNGQANSCVELGAHSCAPQGYNTCLPQDVTECEPPAGDLSATESAEARVNDVMGLLTMPV